MTREDQLSFEVLRGVLGSDHCASSVLLLGNMILVHLCFSIIFISDPLKAFYTLQKRYLSNDEVEKSEDGVTTLLLLLPLLPLAGCMLSQFMLKSVLPDILKITFLRSEKGLKTSLRR